MLSEHGRLLGTSGQSRCLDLRPEGVYFRLFRDLICPRGPFNAAKERFQAFLKSHKTVQTYAVS